MRGVVVDRPGVEVDGETGNFQASQRFQGVASPRHRYRTRRSERQRGGRPSQMHVGIHIDKRPCEVEPCGYRYISLRLLHLHLDIARVGVRHDARIGVGVELRHIVAFRGVAEIRLAPRRYLEVCPRVGKDAPYRCARERVGLACLHQLNGSEPYRPDGLECLGNLRFHSG